MKEAIGIASGPGSREPDPAVPALRASIPNADEVLITAADWNGSSWDGSPFDHLPLWLRAAVEDGRIKIDGRNHTDYAEWLVETACGPVLAGPDDIISHWDGILTVIPFASAIETRRAETAETGSVEDESAVAESQTP